MTGRQLRDMLGEVLPAAAIEAAVRASGFQRRQRKLDPVALARALVLSGGTPDGGRQADVLRAYLEEGAPNVVRGAFYGWFNERFENLVRELGEGATAYARAMPRHLPGLLDGRTDWRVMDSTVVKVPMALLDDFPGTGDYASLKVHKEYSLGVENVVAYHITPGRDHDGPELVVDASRRGTGLIVDLGYASHALLRDSRTHDVHVIVKLKAGWHVYQDPTITPAQRSTWVVGSAFEGELQGGGDIHLGSGEPFDVDVTVGPPEAPIPVRLVGVPHDKGFCMFLTTVPRSTHDHDAIGILYRLRWTIEIDNKLAKSSCRLDHVQAQTRVSAMILIHGAMIASIIANAIVRGEQVNNGAIGNRVVAPTVAPLHPMLVAKMVARMADRIARMLGDAETTEAEWDVVAGLIHHLGRDPNWRRRPSAIDLVKGRIVKHARARAARQSRDSRVNT